MDFWSDFVEGLGIAEGGNGFGGNPDFFDGFWIIVQDALK